jgi:hypothetical protein
MKEDFIGIINQIPKDISLKYSSKENKNCELSSKGHLSYFSQYNSLSQCSTIISKGKGMQVEIDEKNIEKTLWDFYFKFNSKTIDHIPCKSHIKSCPLSCATTKIL